MRLILPALLAAASAAYAPAVVSSTTVGRWLVLSIGAVLMLALVRRMRFNFGHVCMLGLLVYATASASWSISSYDTFGAALQLLVLAGLFTAVSLLRSDLRAAATALGIGLSLSVPFAVAQLIGMPSPVNIADVPGGLFLSRNTLGEVSAVALVLALGTRAWWGAPGPALLVAMSGSRGALLALMVAGVYCAWKLWPKAYAAILTVGLVYLGIGVTMIRWESVAERTDIWEFAFINLTWLGHGYGTFAYAAPMYVFAHCDPLQLAFELGIGSIFAAGIIWYALHWNGELPAKAALLAALGASLVSFPLEHPMGAALVAILSGHLCGARDREFRSLAVLGNAAGSRVWSKQPLAARAVRSAGRG